MSTDAYLWEEPLYRLILQITTVQVVILGLIVVGIVLVRAVRMRREKKDQFVSKALLQPLMSYLAGDASLDDTHRAVRRYRRRNICLELERYATMLGGGALARIRALYERLDLRNYGIRLCYSSYWWRRLEGVRILGAGGGHDVVDVLLESLDDSHAIVRLAAARSLGRIKATKAIKPLLEMMAEAKQISRRQLAQTLIAFGPAAHPALRRMISGGALSDLDQRLVATLIEVLALTGDIDSAPAIRAVLDSDKLEIRIAAFKAVQLLHVPLTSEEIRQGLTDEQWPVKAQAALAAGKLGDPSVISQLGTCLTDRSWWVRHNAGQALYMLGRQGIAELERIAQHSDDGFARDMAFRTLTSDATYQFQRELNPDDPIKPRATATSFDQVTPPRSEP